jgi:hypothetical protein
MKKKKDPVLVQRQSALKCTAGASIMVGIVQKNVSAKNVKTLQNSKMI